MEVRHCQWHRHWIGFYPGVDFEKKAKMARGESAVELECGQVDPKCPV